VSTSRGLGCGRAAGAPKNASASLTERAAASNG
jgi:hypothetical protein